MIIRQYIIIIIIEIEKVRLYKITELNSYISIFKLVRINIELIFGNNDSIVHTKIKVVRTQYLFNLISLFQLMLTPVVSRRSSVNISWNKEVKLNKYRILTVFAFVSTLLPLLN